MHTMTEDYSKRRREQRADLDLYINKIVGDEPHLARVRDISADGVYLYKLLEPGEMPSNRFGIELKLPNADHVIWAVGEIVREDNSELLDGVAVKFVRIAEHDRDIIRDFVSSNEDIEAETAPNVAYA
jgi:hypothetical protein